MDAADAPRFPKIGAEPPPYHKKVIANKTDKIDRRNIGRMIFPGIFTLDTTFAPAGQGVEPTRR